MFCARFVALPKQKAGKMRLYISAERWDDVISERMLKCAFQEYRERRRHV